MTPGILHIGTNAAKVAAEMYEYPAPRYWATSLDILETIPASAVSMVVLVGPVPREWLPVIHDRFRGVTIRAH